MLTIGTTTVTATPTATTAEYTYAFSKWNDLPNTVTEDVTNITAVFTRTTRSYTLSWVTDGDVLTEGYTSGTVAYGTAITAPNTPTKTGYVFAGWHNGTSVVTPATTMPAANTTYTAQWTAVTYSVRFNKNDEDATGTMSNESFTYDVAKALTSNAFTKTGYNFAGWATSAGGNVVYTDGQSVSNLSATQGAVVDMYAKWTVATYEVALDANGGTGGSTSVTMTYNSADHTAITNPTRTGYTFHSWNTTASSSTRKQVISSKGVMSENVSGYTGVGGVWIRTTMPTTLYARWSQKSYTTTFMHNGNGSISYNGAVVDAGGTAKVYHVSARSLVATPNTGYHFTGWTVSGTNASKVTIADLSAASTTIKATAASATVTAGFAPDEYTISYKDQGDAEFSGVHGSGYPTTHTYGTATVLVSPTKEGYTFDGWYDNAECTGTALTEIGATDYTADFTLYAKWTLITYTINYYLDGGNVTSNPTSYTVESNTITINNPTKDGYTFAGWTGTGLSEASKTVTIDHGSTGDKSYTANWLKNYTITWKIEGVTVKTEDVAYGTTPNYGSTPTKVSNAQYDYSFAGWKPSVYPVDKDQIYSGSFNANTHYYTITWKNWNGDDLEIDGEDQDMQYGAAISYNGERPAKEDPSGKVTYTFIGWSPAFVEGDLVAHDQIYTAQFRGDIVASENSSEPVTISVPTTDIVTTTVETTGKLNIQSPGSLTTNTLILQATSGDGNTNNATNATSGEITGAEYINTTNTNVYFDLTLNSWARHWHAFGVPWPVDLKNDQLIEIKDIKGNEVNHPLIFGRDVDILYYDGNERAKNGPSPACWKYVEDDPSWVLQPGVAYMIGLPIHVGTIRFPKKADKQIAFDGEIIVTNYGGDDTNHNHGWNSVANPTTFHALLNVGEGVTECQVYNGDTIGSDGYTPYDMSGKFVVGQAVYVQVRAPKTTVRIDKATNQDGGISPLAAPRRSQGVSASERLEVQIAPVDAPMADRIYLMADEDKEDHYIITRDLSKAGLSTVRAQMWINRYGLKLCKNTTALRNNQATYPLGISVPQAGEYEISSPAGENGDMLYLTYDGRIIWNLTYAPYSASFEKGTNTRYGLKLVRSNAPAVTTDMEQLSGDNASSPIQKVLIDDQVYVLRGEEIYTITGQKAK